MDFGKLLVVQCLLYLFSTFWPRNHCSLRRQHGFLVKKQNPKPVCFNLGSYLESCHQASLYILILLTGQSHRLYIPILMTGQSHWLQIVVYAF